MSKSCGAFMLGFGVGLLVFASISRFGMVLICFLSGASVWSFRFGISGVFSFPVFYCLVGVLLFFFGGFGWFMPVCPCSVFNLYNRFIRINKICTFFMAYGF